MTTNTPENFETVVLECLSDNLTSLERGRAYKAKDVFPPEIWNNILKDFHKKLGRMLARFVKQGLLPLTRIPSTSQNHSQYVYL